MHEFLAFLLADFHLLVFDVEAQAVVDAHILVGNPDEAEEGDGIAAPVGIQEFEMCDDEEKGGYIMAEAIFAGEEVEEFAASAVFG